MVTTGDADRTADESPGPLRHVRATGGTIRGVIEVVFETHSTSVDNERGAASGWHHSALSDVGRTQARALGRRRRDDGLAAVFSSDLRRAVETTELAFEGVDVALLLDWRLRECDYGADNGGPVAAHVAGRTAHLDVPYPGGESWRQAVRRVGGFLADLSTRWNGRRVLVIGHVATRWALDHYAAGTPLEQLAIAPFDWQQGWEYRLDAVDLGPPVSY
jgi:2,3-bisphosphoglycerate-dependent phosphoglycerate mutase